MRGTLTFLTLAVGLALALASYFFWSAPLGTPINEGFSNPRTPLAPTLFIAGVMLVFLSAVVYELYPEK